MTQTGELDALIEFYLSLNARLSPVHALLAETLMHFTQEPECCHHPPMPKFAAHAFY